MRSCLQSALILINESVAGLVYESANYGALTFRTVALTAVKSDDDAALCEKVCRPFHILVGVPRYSYMYFES